MRPLREQLRREAGGNPREQKSLRSPGWRVSWERIVGAVERAKGERWEEFAERRGDWACVRRRCGLGRRAGRLRLAELGKLAGGLDYANVSKAVARFTRRLEEDAELRQELAAIERRMSNDKI